MIQKMDDSVEQQEHHRHRHRHKRVRRKSGLGGEDYFLFALALTGGLIMVSAVMWILNKPMKWW
jgi:hypothetical protein